MKINNQLFLHKTEPKESLLSPIQNRMFIKGHGGIWTSTYVKEYGSDWVRAYDDMFGMPDEGIDAWLLKPYSNLKVCIVDSLEDLMSLFEKYELKTDFPDYMFRFLDYEKMALDYDGMHLTRNGEHETRMSHPYTLYGWDCECTHWFRWCFEEVKYLGKIMR